MSNSAFNRYAPFIQEYIYRKRWTDLREIQVEACVLILDTDKHVIIASDTASGKTEAAFFPMLTQLDEKPATSIGIMYISPLKALINDQFERLNLLLKDVNIPVWPWHGDVSQTMKKQALREMRGILQITPESLEAMLMRHPEDAARLFGDLRFIVIDEIHALMGSERGLQLLCLMHRLEQLTSARPRRIGLSATLNDYDAALRFLSQGSSREAVAAGVQSRKRSVGLHVENYLLPKDKEAKQAVIDQFHKKLYDLSHQRKCLIFTGSRSSAEKTITALKQIASERGESDIFRVHHGSISKDVRRDAETALKSDEGPMVVAATLTLELGIDIGDLDSTIHIGAPISCASFVQRLGRSGRRTGKSLMTFMDLLSETEEKSVDALAWELLKTIAVIQLYLEKRWVEPFELKKKPFSLLIHQTLSTLMACGSLTPSELAQKVLTLPAFSETITKEEYKMLLLHLIAEGVLLRMENGEILLGDKGEKLAGNFTFYAVFPDSEDWKVFHRNAEIGSMNKRLRLGDCLTLSGRGWKITGVDAKRRHLLVEPTEKAQTISWEGIPGDTHAAIVERMRQVLSEDCSYPYLGKTAQQLLLDMRSFAKNEGILNSPIQEHSGFIRLFPWCGTKTLKTAYLLLKGPYAQKLCINRIYLKTHHIEVWTSLNASEFAQALATLDENAEFIAEGLLKDNKVEPVDKFDSLLPKAMLHTSYLQNELDIPGALELLKRLK